MRAIKKDIIALNGSQMEALLALGRYQRSAEYLENKARECFDGHDDVDEDLKTVDFHVNFRIWHSLWIASIYIVHEGLVQLDVQDTRLNRLRQKGNLDVLRRLRNATFHFEPRWRDQRHAAFFEESGGLTSWASRVHIRHAELIGKMVAIAGRHHPSRETIL